MLKIIVNLPEALKEFILKYKIKANLNIRIFILTKNKKKEKVILKLKIFSNKILIFLSHILVICLNIYILKCSQFSLFQRSISF
jgi:hypothetical protein